MRSPKARDARVLYVDAPPKRRWLRLQLGKDETLRQCVMRRLWHSDDGGAHWIAAAHALEMTDYHGAAQEVAAVMIRCLDLADGFGADEPSPPDKLLAALLLGLPLPRRALLYYEACDVLGYDPAEEPARHG